MMYGIIERISIDFLNGTLVVDTSHANGIPNRNATNVAIPAKITLFRKTLKESDDVNS